MEQITMEVSGVSVETQLAIIQQHRDSERPTLPACYPAEVMDVIEHASRLSCHCQMCAPDVEINRHWPSCLVGKAQKLLGQKVTIKAG